MYVCVCMCIRTQSHVVSAKCLQTFNGISVLDTNPSNGQMHRHTPLFTQMGAICIDIYIYTYMPTLYPMVKMPMTNSIGHAAWLNMCVRPSVLVIKWTPLRTP